MNFLSDRLYLQTLSLAARTGALWHFGGKSCFSDRFQLGGPSSIRSFRANGLGPRDPHLAVPIAGADSLGGEVFWSAGFSLISDLPRRPEWPLKAHAWVNAGRLDNVHQGTHAFFFFVRWRLIRA